MIYGGLNLWPVLKARNCICKEEVFLQCIHVALVNKDGMAGTIANQYLCLSCTNSPQYSP